MPGNFMWYFTRNDLAEGPFEYQKIIEFVRRGDVTSKTPVWTIGLPDWVAAENTSLAELFHGIPPPIKKSSLLPSPPPAIYDAPLHPASSGDDNAPLIERLKNATERSFLKKADGFIFAITSWGLIHDNKNLFVSLFAPISGILTFRHLCKRRTLAVFLRKGCSLDNYFSAIYIPSLWSYAWRSFLFCGVLAIVGVFTSSLWLGSDINLIAGCAGVMLFLWILCSVFVLDMPLWIKRHIKKYPPGSSISPFRDVPATSRSAKFVLRWEIAMIVVLIAELMGLYHVYEQRPTATAQAPLSATQKPADPFAGDAIVVNEGQQSSQSPSPAPPAAQNPYAAIASPSDPLDAFHIAAPIEDTEKGIYDKAEAGDADAQIRLAESYRSIKEVTEAWKWYIKAAVQGNAYAQAWTGIYFASNGDLAASIRWLQRAADQGEPSAQLNLGLDYMKGLGVPKDYVQAYKWFNLAASSTGGNNEVVKAAFVCREGLATTFMSSEQVAEAQRLSTAFVPEKEHAP